MRVRSDCLALALVLLASVPGCKKKEASSAPNMDAAGEARAPGDSADPLAELAALEQRMRAHGLPIASDEKPQPGEAEATEMDAAMSDEGRSEENSPPTAAQVQPEPPTPGRDGSPIDVCTDLCSLSESICALEVRICSLAEEHANDATYADACERAVEDCEVAGQACDGCG
jgi:hypothetical protein